jgi:hypothetical protein
MATVEPGCARRLDEMAAEEMGNPKMLSAEAVISELTEEDRGGGELCEAGKNGVDGGGGGHSVLIAPGREGLEEGTSSLPRTALSGGGRRRDVGAARGRETEDLTGGPRRGDVRLTNESGCN